MQIEKNQGKINFCIMGANFCMNLHLAISFGIIQFQALRENLYSRMWYFFFHFFLPLYFLFEKGIDPLFSFIKSHLQLHRK